MVQHATKVMLEGKNFEDLEDEEEGSESECLSSDYSLGSVTAPTQAHPKGGDLEGGSPRNLENACSWNRPEVMKNSRDADGSRSCRW